MFSKMKLGGWILLFVVIFGLLYVGLNFIGPLVTNNNVKVHVVTYAGMAGGPYFNRGYAPNSNSLYQKEYGLNVEFVVIDNLTLAKEGFKTGDINICVLTVDAMPVGLEEFIKFEPVVFGQTDISQGADVVTVMPDINSWSDLKGKPVGFVEASPSQTIVLNGLDAADMSYNDIVPVTYDEVPQIVDAMIAGQLKAGVLWAPDDQTVYEKVRGSKPMWTTKEGSQMIFGIMYANKEWLDKNLDIATKVLEGWMRGNAEINASIQARQLAAQIMSDAYGNEIPAEFFEMSFDNVRLATYNDQVNFFGLNPLYQGMTAERSYIRSAQLYQKVGLITGQPPAWRQISDTRVISAINLTGPEHAAQKLATFTPPTAEVMAKQPIAVKSIRVNFATNAYKLDETAKMTLDGYVDIMRMNQNSRFRVDGHTDNVGDYEYNKRLSYQRAKAAVDYYVASYGFDRNKFIIQGHGPDKPVADNSTEKGRWLNRRTDFGIVPE